MCGICGILDPQGDRADRNRRVARMSAALVHRGPDDDGAFEDADVALGFRRLAVIDLETGAQPIRLEDDRAVVVLNGEIYNYRELRRELEGRHRFRTRGDVEVALRLLDDDGLDALARLDGMFALALWLPRRRTLVLARDRFGIKPLYVARAGGRVAFASELGALLAGGFPPSREVDGVELRHYLAWKYLSPGGSLLRGVRAIEPGTALEIGPGGERVHRFWTPPEPASDRSSDVEAIARLRGLLAAAAERQLVADVPVGAFLSGGVDSGTLVALVARAGARPVRTFSVGFTDAGVANELAAAREAASFLETEHHEVTLDGARVAADLDAILARLDGPLGDATAIPTWYMSRLARERVTVALSGEGADELFGGYDRQRFDVFLDRLGTTGRALVPWARALAGRPVSDAMRRRLGMPPGIERQLDWSRLFGADRIDALSDGVAADENALRGSLASDAARFSERAARDPVHARLAVDRERFLVGDLLPKVDRMSMAHSLEVRVPYLDNAVADFVLAQPGRRLVRRTAVKWLLRRAAAPLLPGTTAARRKQGFDAPVAAWLRGALRAPLSDLLSDGAVRRRGWFRAPEVRTLVEAHVAGREDHGERLWALMALEGWARAALDVAPVGTAP